MRLIDEECGVEAAKFWVDDRERAQSPAEERPFEQHAQAVAIDGEAGSSGEFLLRFGMNADETPGEFVPAHPDEKNNHQRQERAQ